MVRSASWLDSLGKFAFWTVRFSTNRRYRMLARLQDTSYSRIPKANDPSSPYFKVRGGYLTTLRLPASYPGTPTCHRLRIDRLLF